MTRTDSKSAFRNQLRKYEIIRLDAKEDWRISEGEDEFGEVIDGEWFWIKGEAIDSKGDGESWEGSWEEI